MPDPTFLIPPTDIRTLDVHALPAGPALDCAFLEHVCGWRRWRYDLDTNDRRDPGFVCLVPPSGPTPDPSLTRADTQPINNLEQYAPAHPVGWSIIDNIRAWMTEVGTRGDLFAQALIDQTRRAPKPLPPAGGILDCESSDYCACVQWSTPTDWMRAALVVAQYEARQQTPTTVAVWTMAYRPFLVGGRVNGPIRTTLPVTGPAVDVGHGIRLLPVTAPSGATFYVDTTTGGLMGQDPDVVRTDLEGADPEFVRRQIVAMTADGVRADGVTPATFWRLLRQDAPTGAP